MKKKSDISVYIKKDIKLIQDFMDENLGDGRKITGAEIYDKLNDKLQSSVTKAVFMSSLSENIKLGNVSGYEGRKGVGYTKIGDTVKISRKRLSLREKSAQSKVANHNDEDDAIDTGDDVSNKFCIEVNKNIRIIVLGDNVIRQKMTPGGTWANQAYHSTIAESLKSTAKYLLLKKVKSSPQTLKLNEVVSVLNQIEASIMAELVNKAGDTPINKKVSEMSA